jgi:hypothetical protein
VHIGSNFNACIREVVGLNPGRHIENPAVFSGFTTPSREILEYYIIYFKTAYYLVFHSLLFTVIQLLSAFAKLRKATVKVVMSKICCENSIFINIGQA